MVSSVHFYFVLVRSGNLIVAQLPYSRSLMPNKWLLRALRYFI